MPCLPTANLPSRASRSGFTLIELLVVISIIALLIGILLPVLSTARVVARNAKCASNQHQLGIALAAYSTDHKGKYPANNPAITASWWYQFNVIGYYMPGDTVTGTGSLGGLALPCPSDIDTAARSYAMNGWGSSETEGINKNTYYVASKGKMWDSTVAQSSNMMLVVEAWSINPYQGQYYSRPVLGFFNLTPYQKFVSDPEPAGRLAGNAAESRLDYSRHKMGGDNPREARGSINLLYVDGHVALRSDNDLVDRGASKSTYDSLWNPEDSNVE